MQGFGQLTKLIWTTRRSILTAQIFLQNNMTKYPVFCTLRELINEFTNIKINSSSS